MQSRLDDYEQLDGYEIFRRAIVGGDEQAWAIGIARYRAMLIVWARRSAASTAIAECCEDIADQAIARAWVALTPERFDQFPNIAALLAYLHTCVVSAVADYARREQSAERLALAIEVGEVATPEQIVLARFDRDELWQIVNGVVQSEQERVVLVQSMVVGLPPRAILASYPHIFANVDEVYTAKRNLFERLRRCRELRRLYDERRAA
jgi:DNA-directed RNA polymerase specialized sigma24 family protein